MLCKDGKRKKSKWEKKRGITEQWCKKKGELVVGTFVEVFRSHHIHSLRNTILFDPRYTHKQPLQFNKTLCYNNNNSSSIYFYFFYIEYVILLCTADNMSAYIKGYGLSIYIQLCIGHSQGRSYQNLLYCKVVRKQLISWTKGGGRERRKYMKENERKRTTRTIRKKDRRRKSSRRSSRRRRDENKLFHRYILLKPSIHLLIFLFCFFSFGRLLNESVKREKRREREGEQFLQTVR